MKINGVNQLDVVKLQEIADRCSPYTERQCDELFARVLLEIIEPNKPSREKVEPKPDV